MNMRRQGVGLFMAVVIATYAAGFVVGSAWAGDGVLPTDVPSWVPNLGIPGIFSVFLFWFAQRYLPTKDAQFQALVRDHLTHIENLTKIHADDMEKARARFDTMCGQQREDYLGDLKQQRTDFLAQMGAFLAQLTALTTEIAQLRMSGRS